MIQMALLKTIGLWVISTLGIFCGNCVTRRLVAFGAGIQRREA